MIIITRRCHVVFGMLLLCSAGSAVAEDSGFYVGLDEGWVKYPGGALRQIGTTTLTGTGLNDTNFTWDFNAGYRLNRYFSVEAGYVDLGERSGLVRGPSGATGAIGDVSFAARGETLVAIGTLPFGKWDATFKAGILHADAHLDFSGVISNEPYGYRIAVVNTHPAYGVGFDYNVDAHWRGRFGLVVYQDVGSATRSSDFRVAGPDIVSLTLGVAYQF